MNVQVIIDFLGCLFGGTLAGFVGISGGYTVYNKLNDLKKLIYACVCNVPVIAVSTALIIIFLVRIVVKKL